MKLCFVDLEPLGREFFAEAFPSEEIWFGESLDEVPEEAEAVSVFIGSRITRQFLERHPAVKLIATRSTTTDHIDLRECAARGVTVRTVESYGDHTVTEHTFALLLMLTRRMREATSSDSRHSFSYEALRSTELHGKTLGVIGTGRIGRQTLRLGKAFGMETIGMDLSPDPAVAAEIGFRYVDLEELLRSSHVISLHVPLTVQTFHLFNRETFSQCRRGAFLINTARGALIETQALAEALDAGILGGAGLDVLEDERVFRRKASNIISEQIIERLHVSYAPIEPLVPSAERADEVRRLMRNSELLSRPNVVCTAHIAFNSVEAIARINRATAQNIETFFAARASNGIRKKPGARKARSYDPI
jgi:D-lactate dehydrogenase